MNIICEGYENAKIVKKYYLEEAALILKIQLLLQSAHSYSDQLFLMTSAEARLRLVQKLFSFMCSIDIRAYASEDIFLITCPISP